MAFQNLKGKEGKIFRSNILHICELESKKERRGGLFFLVHQNSPSSSFRNSLMYTQCPKAMFPGYYRSTVSLHHFTHFSSRKLGNLGAYLVTRKSFRCFVNLPGTHSGTILLQENMLPCAAEGKCGLDHQKSPRNQFNPPHYLLSYQRTFIFLYCSPPVSSKASLLNKGEK